MVLGGLPHEGVLYSRLALSGSPCITMQTISGIVPSDRKQRASNRAIYMLTHGKSCLAIKSQPAVTRRGTLALKYSQYRIGIYRCACSSKVLQTARASSRDLQIAICVWATVTGENTVRCVRYDSPRCYRAITTRRALDLVLHMSTNSGFWLFSSIHSLHAYQYANHMHCSRHSGYLNFYGSPLACPVLGLPPPCE